MTYVGENEFSAFLVLILILVSWVETECGCRNAYHFSFFNILVWLIVIFDAYVS